MAAINITNIDVLDPPHCPFLHPFKFDITFECISPLASDLEWRVIYVGSASSKEYDQELESILVGPIPVGVNRFVFEAPPPKPELIPDSTDIPGVTVVLLSCSYRQQEFVRIGYYCAVDYNLEPPATEEERLAREEAMPKVVDWASLKRSLLREKPKVTRYPIAWDQGMDETQMKEEDIHMAAEMEDESMRTAGGISQMSVDM